VLPAAARPETALIPAAPSKIPDGKADGTGSRKDPGCFFLAITATQ
jgi:hypothetical protein